MLGLRTFNARGVGCDASILAISYCARLMSRPARPAGAALPGARLRPGALMIDPVKSFGFGGRPPRPNSGLPVSIIQSFELYIGGLRLCGCCWDRRRLVKINILGNPEHHYMGRAALA